MKKYRIVWFLCCMMFLSAHAQSDANQVRFKSFMTFAQEKKWQNLTPGERVSQIARFFIGTPYVGGTLEFPGPEQMRFNLNAFDCNTFVENVLSLSILLDEEQQDWARFKEILETIRYRYGVLNGYTSRLHYLSDWLVENSTRAVFDWVDAAPGMEPFKPNVSYMSKHPDLYPALKNNPGFVDEIALIEAFIRNKYVLKYMPKAKVTKRSEWIQNGDVIAITTNMEGLDFSHVGIDIRKKGLLYLIHASSSGKKVEISTATLNNYLADIKKHTGIVVVRPM